jgi:hypothetical protein
MPLRALARVGPLALGALAATIWLRRRRYELPALPPGETPPRPQSARFVRASESPRVDIVAVVDDLLGTPR